MKRPTLLLRLATIHLLVALANCSAEGSRGVLPSESANTRRILSSIDQAAPRRTEADRLAAERLNREGDAAYLKGNYRAALSAYSNSYPNYPTAHAYILAGDCPLARRPAAGQITRNASVCVFAHGMHAVERTLPGRLAHGSTAAHRQSPRNICLVTHQRGPEMASQVVRFTLPVAITAGGLLLGMHHCSS